MVRAVMRGLVVFVLSYMALRLSGLFTDEPAGFLKTLYSPFVIVPLILFVLLGFYRFFRVRRLSHLMVDLGLLALVSGLLIGYYYCDARELVITVGQVYRAGQRYPLERVLYRGAKARQQRFIIKFSRAVVSFSRDGMRLNSLRAEFDYYGEKKREPEKLTLQRGLIRPGPEGMFFGIRDFGYSMHYLFRFEDAVDEAFVALELFPPGREDYFRLVFSPHTYYIKFEPQKKARPIGLRIARNKDLIYDNYIGFHQPVKFEKATLTFTEARKWTRLIIINDRGIYLYLLCPVFLVIGGLLKLREGRADA